MPQPTNHSLEWMKYALRTWSQQHPGNDKFKDENDITSSAQRFIGTLQTKGWDAFLQSMHPELKAIVEAAPDFKKGVIENTHPNAVQAEEAQAAAGNPDHDRLRAFIAAMQNGPDQNDPAVQRIMQLSASAGEKSARLRGIEGGLSVQNTQNMVGRSLMDLDMQRKGLSMQAEGALLGQQNLTEAQLNNDYNRQMQQYRMQLEQAQGKQAQEQQQNSGMWSTALGAIGSVAGSYFGMPGLGQAGASLGAGLGGMSGGPMQYPGLPQMPGLGSGGGWRGA